MTFPEKLPSVKAITLTPIAPPVRYTVANGSVVPVNGRFVELVMVAEGEKLSDGVMSSWTMFRFANPWFPAASVAVTVMRFPVFVASDTDPEKVPSQSDTVFPLNDPFEKTMARFASVDPFMSIVGVATV